MKPRRQLPSAGGRRRNRIVNHQADIVTRFDTFAMLSFIEGGLDLRQLLPRRAGKLLYVSCNLCCTTPLWVVWARRDNGSLTCIPRDSIDPATRLTVQPFRPIRPQQFGAIRSPPHRRTLLT